MKVLMNEGITFDIKDEDKDRLSPLHQAILDGDLENTELLLELNETLGAGKCTPFMLACLYGHLHIVKFLFSVEELRKRDSFGNTPLMYAARNGHNDIAKWLLEQGAELNDTNIHGDTAFFTALRYKHSEMAISFLQRKDLQFDEPNVMGYEPYVIAIVNGDLEIAKILCPWGMDLNKKYTENNTLLHMVAMTGDVGAAVWLLQHGVEANHINGYGLTPLGMAAAKGHDEMVKFLIEYIPHTRAFFSALENALIAASAQGHVKVVDLILRHTRKCSEVFIHFILMTAAIKGHWNVINNILNMDPDREQKRINKHYNYGDFDYQKGNTLLHAAADQGHLIVVDHLLARRADLRALNNNGDTVLHCAVRSGSVELVRKICNQNVFVNHANKQGNTPMHFAVQLGNPEIVRCLLMHGGSIKLENKQKETAEVLARSVPALRACFDEYKANKFANFGLEKLHLAVTDSQDKALLQVLPVLHDLSVRSVDGLTPTKLAANLGNYQPLVILLLWEGKCNKHIAYCLAKELQQSYDPKTIAFATLGITMQKIQAFPEARLAGLVHLKQNLDNIAKENTHDSKHIIELRTGTNKMLKTRPSSLTFFRRGGSSMAEESEGVCAYSLDSFEPDFSISVEEIKQYRFKLRYSSNLNTQSREEVAKMKEEEAETMTCSH